MIRKRAELNMKNPPGQLVYPPVPAKAYKPVHGGYPDIADTEEMFASYPKMKDGCCHKTVHYRCSDCSFRARIL
jgi:hypothetical protein